MFGSDYFSIIHGKTFTIGECTGSGATLPLEKFTAMKRTAAETALPGSGDMTGFLAQKVTAAGPSFEDKSFNLDLVAKAGEKVSLISLEDGGEFEVEGEPSKGPTDTQSGLLVTSGTGAVSASTSAGTQLSVTAGRWRVAQTGDYVFGIYRKNLTPLADSSNVRCLVEFRRSGIKVS